MTEIAEISQVALRAADLADRCEAAGALVAAAVLRGVAADVEEMIIRTGAALVVGWIGGEPEPAPSDVS